MLLIFWKICVIMIFMKSHIKTALKVIAAVTIIATVYSFLPVVRLYVSKDAPAVTNAVAIEKLKAGDGGHFAFIFFGDNHAGLIFNDSATLKIISRIRAENRYKKAPVDFVLSSGDVTFRGSPWQYRIFNRIRALIKWPFICTMGNHDDDKGGAARFGENVGPANFSFPCRNSYFIFVDDSRNDISEEQFLRIENELKISEPYTHRFIIMHKSPISVYYQSWYRPELSPWSYRFMKMCEKYRVDMVLSGHEHMFGAREFGGVKYVTSGGGGMLSVAPSWDNGFLHYIVVRVYGDYVDYEVRRVFPPLWEFFTFYMWKDIYWFVKDVLF